MPNVKISSLQEFPSRMRMSKKKSEPSTPSSKKAVSAGDPTASIPTNKSHLTAIGRKALPGPTRWLFNNARIKGKVLDYGCGRCHSVNNQHFKADGFDPHFEFDQTDASVINSRKYDTIICNYVLCVLREEERQTVLRSIQSLLSVKGIAYIAVRNDKPKQGWGVSSKGTYQGRVRKLPLELLRTTKDYRIYLLTRGTELIK